MLCLISSIGNKKKAISCVLLGIISISFVLVPIAYGKHKTNGSAHYSTPATRQMLSYMEQAKQHCEPSRVLEYLNHGASADGMDSSGFQPLLIALSNGAQDCALILLDHGAISGIKEPAEPSEIFALSLAAGSNTCDPKVIEALIRRGADPNPASGMQDPLQNAAMAKNIKCANTLISSGAKVNFHENPRAVTPLMVAVLPGFRSEKFGSGKRMDERIKMVRLLLSHGADPNMKTKLVGGQIEHAGQTALFMAVGLAKGIRPCAACARLLLAAGANPNVVDDAGRTPLLWALAPDHSTTLEAIKVLIRGGAKVNLANPKTDETPLMAAAGDGYKAIVQYLLSAGAMRCARDNRGRTAFDYSRIHKHMALAKLLSCPIH